MKIVFVYNANSNPLSKLINAGHKIIQPKTYACDLCNLTHGSFGEKKIWKDFRKKTAAELVFMYEDEFAVLNIENFNVPLIYKESNDKVDVILDAIALNKIDNLEGLIQLIEAYISRCVSD